MRNKETISSSGEISSIFPLVCQMLYSQYIRIRNDEDMENFMDDRYLIEDGFYFVNYYNRF